MTQILNAINEGDPQAAEQLLPLVYDELRKLAAAKLAHEKPGQTLQATALVHEAYLRLVGGGIERDRGREGDGETDQPLPLAPSSLPPLSESPAFHSRGHFFAAAAEAMRRILIDQARSRGRQKRGGDRKPFDIDAIDVAVHATPDQLLSVDEALLRLEREDPDVYALVQLRYFAGLNVEQAAAALGISVATAYRHWNYARAWLHSELLEP